MSGILSKPKMADNSRLVQMQSDAMKKQSEVLDKQEARIEEQEKTAQRQMASRSRARRRGRGAYRLLLSPERGSDAAQGIKGSETNLG